MTGKSNYLEDKILNWAFKATTMGAAPSAIYVGLWNGDPLDTGLGGTEVTTTIRVAGRVAATFGSISTGADANSISNSTDVDFGVAAGSASVTHFAIFDAASAGNMLYSGALTGGAQAVLAGGQVKFAAGQLTVSES